MLYKIYELLYWTMQKKIPLSKPQKQKNDRMVIVANGPSAELFFKKMQERKDEEELEQEIDILMLNHIIYKRKKEVFEIKPKYYVLIDPGFENNNSYKEKITRELEEITWEMTLIVSVQSNLEIKNKKIKKIILTPVMIRKFPKIRKFLYERNYALPSLDNVSIAAMYFAITWGYKRVELYGVDFTNFLNIYVDENNELHEKGTHAYVEDEDVKDYNSAAEHTTVVAFWKKTIEVFESFYILKDYANKKGTEIINRNVYSLLDAFDKKE